MKDIQPVYWLCRACIALVLALSLISVRAATSSPPELMTYQGYLVDNNGIPLGNTAPKNYDVVFRIWSEQTAGVRLWAEQQTITIDKGYFSVLLGEGAVYSGEPRPVLSTLFTGPNASDRFIEVMVKGIGAGGIDVTISPRLRFLASPYALLAKTSVSAQNLVNSTYNQVVNISGINVGINKVAPGSALDVNGTVTATTFSGSGSSLTSLNANNLSSGTVADARLSANVAKLNANQTFTGSNTFTGNVVVGGDLQIGTHSNDPQHLQIGGGNSFGFLYGSYRGLYDGIHLGYNYYYDAAGSGQCIVPSGGTTRLTLGYGEITLATGGSNAIPAARLFVNAAGNVGIGTTTPGFPLTFPNSLGSKISLWGQSGNHYGLGIQSSTLQIFGDVSSSKIVFGYGHSTNLTETMRIQGNGTVGIGTTSPDRPLTIKASGTDGLQWLSLKNSGNTTTWHVNNLSNGVNFAESGVRDFRLFLAPGGKVGINTSNPAVALHVIGQVKISDLPAIGDERNVQWDESTKTLGRYSSSRRYKENIQPMETEWSAVLAAQPVTYNFIGRPDRVSFGLIAEDLDALGLEPLVVYDEAGRPDSVRYEKLGLYLLQIVKAQQVELKEKDTRLQSLEQSIVDLKAMVSALAEQVNASGK